MNHKEVTKEFYRDLTIIKATTLTRLGEEYRRERKKFKIKPESFYPKVYRIKTKAKNPWMIFMCKAPSSQYYKTLDDHGYCCITFYHSKKGLEVLREYKEIKGIECFWGHFFNRYNQRMNLKISSIDKIIEHYFLHNLSVQHCITSIDTGKSIGICREGFVFGQLTYNNTWLINKTFVSNETASNGKKKFAAKLIDLTEQDLIKQLADKQFDAVSHERTKELLIDLKRA
jgi:hypothetical protein